MLRIPRPCCLCVSILCLPLMLGAAGCGASATKDGPKAAPAAPPSGTEAGGSASQPAAANDEPDAEVRAELAKLPPDDRALAEKQKVCPVTGELLGSMGAPYKVTVKGRTVFLCCAGCEEKLKKDPDKYLAKLKDTEAR